MLSLALGASLIIAWQPLDREAQRVRWQRRHARPDALPLEPPVAATSRGDVVRAFRLGAGSIACLDCAPAPTVEALPAEAAPEALRLVPHMSSGTSLSGSILQPLTALAERVEVPAWSRHRPAGTNGSARCARPGRRP